MKDKASVNLGWLVSWGIGAAAMLTAGACALDAGEEEGIDEAHVTNELVSIEKTQELTAVSFAISNALASELDGGIFFTVTKTGDDGLPHSMRSDTQNGTARAPSDYTALVNGTLTFTAAESKKSIIVALRNTEFVEGDEYFFVNLSNLTNGGTIADAQGRGRILNSGPQP